MLFALSASAQQLVQNGGFETGNFSGWTQSGNKHSTAVTTNLTYVHSGNYGAELGPDGPSGFLSQSLATAPNQTYLLSLWLYCDGSSGTFFQVSWNGTVLFDQTNPPAVGWTNLQFTVTATSASTVLQFQFLNSPSYFGLDDVSVTPLTYPVIYGWGDKSYGQLHFPTNLTNVTAIAAGGLFSMALKNDGTVAAWGDNSTSESTVPYGLPSISAISAGGGIYLGNFGLALKSNQTITSFGYGLYGQTSIPSGLSNVVAISAGGDVSMALKSDGTVVAFGSNSHGETNVPAGLSSVRAISAGYYFCTALRSNGTVVAWGFNVDGETNVPPDLTNVAAISAGGYFNLALLSNGTVTGWGDNSLNELNFPPGLTNVVAISAGEYCALALKANGTVVGWGYNYPSIPAGLSNVVAIANGREYDAPFALALTFSPPPPPTPTPPLNDNFANATTISGNSVSVSGSNVDATKQSGEPNHASNPGGASAWWTWSTSQSGTTADIDTYGSSFDTLIAVYTGNSVSGLTLVADNSYCLGCSVEFQPTASTKYYIAVDGYNGGSGPEEGQISLNVSDVCPPPTIDVFYDSQITESNGVHIFFGASINGQVNSCDNWQVLSPASGHYTTIDHGCYSFEVVVSPTNQDPVVVTNTVFGNCGVGSGGSTPVNPCSICLSRGSPNVLAGSTGSGAGPVEPTPCGNVSSYAQWYRMIPSATGPVTVSTEGSAIPTLLAVFNGPLTAPTPIACNSGIASTNKISLLTFNAINGIVYWIVVDPKTNNVSSSVRVASGFQPSIASYGLTNGAFSLQSTIAPAITYQLLATTNPTISLSNWPVVFSTNLSTNYLYLNYQETNMKAYPRRFYLLKPKQ